MIMKTLVIVEHDNHCLNPATLNALTAAEQLTYPITALVAGWNCQSVAEQVSHFNSVEKVWICDAPCYKHILAEDLTTLVLNAASAFRYILVASTTFGRDFLPRVAALLDVAQISDVVEILSKDTFVRPIYAGNAYQTIQTHDAVGVLTIRTTAFKAAIAGEYTAPIEQLAPIEAAKRIEFVKQMYSDGKRPDLTQARVVIAGGRGLQSAENFQMLEALADRLGAAIGASRAAVDAGFVSNDYQIGQTGKVVAPELYIAIGISGAIQHVAGMKDSKIIVAINKDGSAPIFQIADYGLVGDLFEIVPELCKELDRTFV
jgi:electron transfer flavoprotein alpha subunit